MESSGVGAEIRATGQASTLPGVRVVAHLPLRGVQSSAWRRDRLFRRSLLLADASAFLSTIVVVSILSSRPLAITWVGVFGACALCLGAKILGLYDRDEALLRKSTLDEAPRLFQVATLGAMLTWLAGGFVVSGSTLTRPEALLFWSLLTVCLVLGRGAARSLALRAATPERCLFIGDPAVAAAVRKKFLGHRGLKADLVAEIDPAEAGRWSAAEISVARLEEVHSLARSLQVERAILSPESVSPQQMTDLICTLKAVGIKVSVLPRMLEVVGNSVEFDDLYGLTVMGVKRFVLSRSSRLVKRSFDLVGSSVALLATAPLMLGVALAIRLEGRGPILFHQLRVGRNGEHFEMLKFRTMVAEAEELKDSLRARNEAVGGHFKIEDDPRITRIGRPLRRTGLDELPQLINVLRGEMSLVGPRPLPLDEDPSVAGWHRFRLELMPGITGPWQILGPARVPLQEMGAIDYLYVANWSLWGDLKILLRTVGHVLGRRGM